MRPGAVSSIRMEEAATLRRTSNGERTLRLARYPFETASNPYQGLLYRSLAHEGVVLEPDRPFTATALIRMRPRVEVLHFNWRLDRLYGSRPTRPRVALARARLRLAKLLGYRIAWTIHDLATRERPDGREPMADALARTADVLFCHDEALAARAALELGIDGSRITVVPHGPLGIAYPASPVSGAETRARLGLLDGETVFLAFGAFLKYKEVDLVLAGFRRVTVPGARLVVAGEPLAVDVAAEIRAAAAADPRVVLLDRRILVAEVRALFEACDIAVFGRRDGWTSGALVLALDLGLPAVVAACPAYVNLVADRGSGWTFDPAGGSAALGSALRDALATPRAEREKAGARAATASAEITWADVSARMAMPLRGAPGPLRLPVLEAGTADA